MNPARKLTSPAALCLGALAALAAAVAVLRGCRDDRARDLEKVVLQSLDLDAVEVIQFGPHRLGERSSTIRCRYKTADGRELDELFLVQEGRVLLFRPTPDGWPER